VLALIFLGAGGLTGCETWKTGKPNSEALQLAVEGFNDAIRWRDYLKAGAWIAPEEQDRFWRQTEMLQANFRIFDYQILRLDCDEPTGSGWVTLRYRFYRVANPSLQSITLQQSWRFLFDIRHWQLARGDLQAILESDL
jgi:hypothetical protein